MAAMVVPILISIQVYIYILYVRNSDWANKRVGAWFDSDLRLVHAYCGWYTVCVCGTDLRLVHAYCGWSQEANANRINTHIDRY
jgi:hypothetical protein